MRIDLENHIATTAWVDAMFANMEAYPRLEKAPDGIVRMYYKPGVWIPFY